MLRVPLQCFVWAEVNRFGNLPRADSNNFSESGKEQKMKNLQRVPTCDLFAVDILPIFTKSDGFGKTDKVSGGKKLNNT